MSKCDFSEKNKRGTKCPRSYILYEKVQGFFDPYSFIFAIIGCM